MRTSPGRASVVLGVDVGSTNVKIVAIGVDSQVVARVCRPTPRLAADLSIDAAELFGLLEEMVVEACGNRHAVKALCAAGVGEDGLLVDRDAQPLTPALAWFDPRRTEIFRALEADLTAADGVGVASDPARTFVGWAWARHQAGADRADAWLALTDFASCRWADTKFLSDTLAARTAAWRVLSRSWLTGRVQATLGSVDLLPDVVSAGDIVGGLRSKGLAQAGVLATDAVVVAGGHDHPVGSWCAGQLHPGAILDSMGTAEVVVAQSPSPDLAASQRVDTSPGIRTSGTTLLRVEELARNMAWAAQDPQIADALRDLLAGHLWPDKYLHSETFLPGAAGGASPRYTDDAPAGPISRASAVLGALAALGNDAVRDITGLMSPGTRVYAAGGWTRSLGWIKIKQAISGSKVNVLPEPEVTAAGAALLAASAAGWEIDATTALSAAETRRFTSGSPPCRLLAALAGGLGSLGLGDSGGPAGVARGCCQ